MPIKMRPFGVLFLLLVALWVPGIGYAGIPDVSHVMVTDVTTVSFSVIWASSEASTADLEVYEDAAGTIAVSDYVITPHPVNNGDAAIQTAAEDNGVMKVMVTGLEADTTYYFQTADHLQIDTRNQRSIPIRSSRPLPPKSRPREPTKAVETSCPSATMSSSSLVTSKTVLRLPKGPF